MNTYSSSSVLRKAALFSASLIALIVVTITPQAQGSVILINDNFESYNLGEIPGNPGDGNSNNWSFTGLNTNNVITGSSVGGTAPNEQVLHIQADGTGASLSKRQFNRVDGSLTADLQLTLSFKLKLNQVSGSHYNLRLVDSEKASPNNPMVLSIINGSVALTTGVNGPGSGAETVYVPALGTLASDVWYEFVLHADMNTQMYSLAVTNLNTEVVRSTDSLYFLRNLKSVDTLEFYNRTTTNMAVNWHIDDVLLTASIPEVETATLLFGGIMALLVLRIRTRRRDS